MINFPLPSQNLNQYIFIHEKFSQENLNRLFLNIEELNNYTEGLVHENTFINRKSQIKWIPNDTSFSWLYELLHQYFVKANSSFGFEIVGTNDIIQYTEYNSQEKGHYDWHTDLSPYENNYRKLSLTIQLSDPDEYEGGDLELAFDGSTQKNTTIVPKEKGYISIFPSFTPHRVTPVTKGIRKSLVWWVGGIPFK